jgi:serine-type D-Ala-D-Ala carboxypeptidase (penicillin-binding protein 5/6)|tara:strand:- start:10291 stop:11442 length:1152 start_codon:yes stop_codon:yes gene_type:complete
MNNYIKYIFILFITWSLNVSADPKINIKTGILIDYHTDKILYELEPDMSIYPASMTKIMTAIIAFDLLKSKKLSLDDKITISDKAWRMSQAGYSSMFIMVNDQISVENLLRGIIVASGNDACVALAEGIAGTEEDFAIMMTEKAQEIGMTNTNFSNASGLNDPDNYSTVRDIALMSKYLISNYPDYYEYFKETEFTWDRTGGNPITQQNRNLLLFRNIGVDGIKTGHLAVEEYSLASSIMKESRRLIAVGSGFKTIALRSSQSRRLLYWGLTNSETFEIAKKNEINFEIETWLGQKRLTPGYTKEDVYYTVDKKDIRNLNIFLEYSGPIKAPIRKDDEIAQIKIYNKDELIKTVPIYAAEKVKKINFLLSLFTSFNYMIWGDA